MWLKSPLTAHFLLCQTSWGSYCVGTAATAAPVIEKPDGGETRRTISWLNALINARPLSGTAAWWGESEEEEEAEDSFTYCIGGERKPRELENNLFVWVPQVIPRSLAHGRAKWQRRRNSTMLICIERVLMVYIFLFVCLFFLYFCPNFLRRQCRDLNWGKILTFSR